VKKALLSLCLGLMAFAAAFAAPVQDITFWTMSLSPRFDPYINGVIADFEKTNPGIKVTWVDVPWGDTETKVLTAAAAGTMPDVANLNLPFAQKLAQSNKLVDFASADVKKDYFPGCWNASKYGNVIYGLPWYITVNMLFYNKDLFKKAGLDPSKPPKSYEDLYACAKAIKAKTGAYGYMTYFNDTYIMEELELMGIRLFDDSFTHAQFNTPAVLSSVKYYKKMLAEGLIPSQTLTAKSGSGDAVQLYSSGRLAIFSGGTSNARMIKENNANVYDATAVAPLIKGPNGRNNLAVMNVVVSKDSPNQDAAVKFAKFLTNNANQLAFAKDAGTIIPSTADCVKDPFFSKDDGTAGAAARIMSAREVASGSIVFPTIANWSEISGDFLTAFQASVAGAGDPVTLLQKAQDKANALLAAK